jgi:riboflavin kinase/FMN adenylyltransferase
MKVVYGLTHFKPLDKKPVVALGIFDGLHRGHQRIITDLLKEAKAFRTLSLVITFFPHPQRENSLYSLRHRLKLLEEAGIDLCLVIRFSPAFRKMPACEFLQRVLIKRINPRAVLIGRNFSFGRNAEGNWRMIKDYSKKAKFKLRITRVLSYNGLPISSSYIRALIKGGKFLRAQELLGRPVTIFGRVTKGEHLGRILGYPTANINPEQEILPPCGVYAVRVRVANRLFRGICYIGNKPTFNPTPSYLGSRLLFRRGGGKASSKTNIEVHIFDFKKVLYGRRIQIEFIKGIRPQKRFRSVGALASQIKRDIVNCHKTFRK